MNRLTQSFEIIYKGKVYKRFTLENDQIELTLEERECNMHMEAEVTLYEVIEGELHSSILSSSGKNVISLYQDKDLISEYSIEENK